jgi:hypothetical protein
MIIIIKSTKLEKSPKRNQVLFAEAYSPLFVNVSDEKMLTLEKDEMLDY